MSKYFNRTLDKNNHLYTTYELIYFIHLFLFNYIDTNY